LIQIKRAATFAGAECGGCARGRKHPAFFRASVVDKPDLPDLVCSARRAPPALKAAVDNGADCVDFGLRYHTKLRIRTPCSSPVASSSKATPSSGP
jgi:hypothetical protein